MLCEVVGSSMYPSGGVQGLRCRGVRSTQTTTNTMNATNKAIATVPGVRVMVISPAPAFPPGPRGSVVDRASRAADHKAPVVVLQRLQVAVGDKAASLHKLGRQLGVGADA